MPNTPDNDSELSALLHKAEPPQSPAHLDDAILRYARENAPAQPQHSFPNMHWLQRNWVSAAATFSVAAIAISVSLQFFIDPELPGAPARSRTQELALGVTPAPALAEADAKALAEDVVERELPATQAAAPAQEARLRQELAGADATSDLATAVADTALATTTARSSNAAQPAAAPPVTANLAALVSEDAALQDTIIIALRRALGVREQSSVVRRSRFTDEIGIYIETYRGLRDATILANVQNRYSTARADLLDARLPQTIAELVSLLETL